MPEYIDLYHVNIPTVLEKPHPCHGSSLAIYPDHLYVTGVLPHNTCITPKTVEDADRLIDWLQTWKTRKTTSSERPKAHYSGQPTPGYGGKTW